MRLLITGYGPFGTFDPNPSGVLAERSGREHQILPVSYAAVRRWHEELDADSFDALLHIGVSGAASRMLIERYGRNWTRRSADVDGIVPAQRQIETNGPVRRPATIWPREWMRRGLSNRHPHLAHSSEAGGYLCNFVLYESLRRFPDKRVGFLHIPTFEKIPLDTQVEVLRDLIDAIERSP